MVGFDIQCTEETGALKEKGKVLPVGWRISGKEQFRFEGRNKVVWDGFGAQFANGNGENGSAEGGRGGVKGGRGLRRGYVKRKSCRRGRATRERTCTGNKGVSLPKERARAKREVLSGGNER